MKISVPFLLAVLISCSALAQVGGISEEQMQQMISKAQQMQACFEKIDQAALQQFATEGQRVEAQLRSLCSDAKRSEAQQLAMDFARDYVDNKEMAALRDCASQMSDLIPQMPAAIKEMETANIHVCDAYLH